MVQMVQTPNKANRIKDLQVYHYDFVTGTPTTVYVTQSITYRCTTTHLCTGTPRYAQSRLTVPLFISFTTTYHLNAPIATLYERHSV